MNKQDKDGRRPLQNPLAQNTPKNAGGVDDIEKEEERMEDEGGHQPDAGRPSESERPNSPDSRWGDQPKR
jgi:hypothetical protein